MHSDRIITRSKSIWMAIVYLLLLTVLGNIECISSAKKRYTYFCLRVTERNAASDRCLVLLLSEYERGLGDGWFDPCSVNEYL